MHTVSEVLDAIEVIAPSRMALEGDPVGLHIGSLSAEVVRAVVSLDHSCEAIAFCKAHRAQLLVSHHPPLYGPSHVLTDASPLGSKLLDLARHNIAFIAAHTNWDVAPGGVNDVLSSVLGLGEVKPFGLARSIPQLKMVTFIPENSVNLVIDALSQAGAGQIGAYSRCAFLNKGTGTFRPESGANPVQGTVNQIETVDEVRVEMVVPSHLLSKVIEALQESHPYEEVSFDVYDLQPKPMCPLGRIGTLAKPIAFEEFSIHASKALDSHCSSWGDPSKVVERIAVVGGSGGKLWESALQAGADVFLMGEVKHDVALEAEENGLMIVSAGHYATENPGAEELRRRLKEVVPEIEWMFFEPENGKGGRPL